MTSTVSDDGLDYVGVMVRHAVAMLVTHADLGDGFTLGAIKGMAEPFMRYGTEERMRDWVYALPRYALPEPVEVEDEMTVPTAYEPVEF